MLTVHHFRLSTSTVSSPSSSFSPSASPSVTPSSSMTALGFASGGGPNQGFRASAVTGVANSFAPASRQYQSPVRTL